METSAYHLTKAHGPTIRARDDGCKWQKPLAQNSTEGSTTLNRSELITVRKNNKISITVPDTPILKCNIEDKNRQVNRKMYTERS